MDEVADACERRGDRVAIAHVALHHLTVGVDEVGAHAGAPYQRPHRITGAPERLHEGGSDESACACDQDGAGVRTGRLDHHATDSLGSRGGWSIPCNTIKATTPHEFRDSSVRNRMARSSKPGPRRLRPRPALRNSWKTFARRPRLNFLQRSMRRFPEPGMCARVLPMGK